MTGPLALTILRLQVQLRPLKPGIPPNRTYDPTGIVEVTALEVGPDGAFGLAADGTRHIDVHHREHPQTRDAKGRSGLSIMTTGDYVALRERYGAHVADGIAGESLLLDYAPGLAGAAMPEQMTVRTAAGDLVLGGVRIAKPCVPFTRFCLRRSDFDTDDAIKQGLADLDGGARGYKMVAAGAATIRPGDHVMLSFA